MFNIKDRPKPGPAYMSNEQKGQQSHMSPSTDQYSPQKPSTLRNCISSQETSSQDVRSAHYLNGLRNDRTYRPSGSRPLAPSKSGALKRAETDSNGPTQVAHDRPSLPTSNSMPIMPAHAGPHKRNGSRNFSRPLFSGRPLVRPPSTSPTSDEPHSPDGPLIKRKTSVTYMERGTRWMEKQEVKSLRQALEDMDVEDDKRVHSAAQDEAAELVWKHQHPEAAQAVAEAPYANPDLKRDYRSHLRKGSYTRSHSQDAAPVVAQRIASGSSTSSTDSNVATKRRSMDVLRKVSPPTGNVIVNKIRKASGKSFDGLAEAVADDIAKAHRRVSSGSNKRILSGEKKMFMHPNDRIWEDPQEEHASPVQNPIIDPPKVSAPPQPAHVRKNPFARVRMQAEKLERANSEPILSTTMPHSVEIQRNAPSQSKKPWYMSNEPLPPTPPSAGDHAADEVEPKGTPTKNCKEVRGDDIRAATSKQRKDYSPKLPRPTVVSDKPGRPIVSFKQDWKPKEVVMEEMKAGSSRRGSQTPNRDSVSARSSIGNPMANMPQISVDEVAKPPIPIINVPDDPAIPSIVLPEEPGHVTREDIRSAPPSPAICVEPPSINIESPSIQVNGSSAPPQRPNPSQRPQPRHAATSPLPKSTPHYSPSVRQSGALCAHCALPIAGRILSAAGERFHPECFVCHECHTNLELVAFYPEPENKRAERLERIAARREGYAFPGQGAMEPDELLQLEIADADEALRFYCHLDFHELYSPRCKSCKTPIEGEVIVACGAEWHQGHFFCAQCGDPFDSSTPFVEKDGYAWCVGCHTNRYSSKCRKCRKPVTDTVIKALGCDWHEKCFVCTECNGEFQDGKYFLRGESADPVCVRCEQRRLKA